MNQPISIEKIFEMYGRVSLERDMIAEENQRLKQEVERLKSEKKEG
jgi:hypothetical protein